jgi:hypothetical protein
VAETNLLKWRHYESEIILLCVRWYLRYALSYRDLEEMMEERNLSELSVGGDCLANGQKTTLSTPANGVIRVEPRFGKNRT